MHACMHSRLRLEFMSNCAQFVHYSQMTVRKLPHHQRPTASQAGHVLRSRLLRKRLLSYSFFRRSPSYFLASSSGSHPVNCFAEWGPVHVERVGHFLIKESIGGEPLRHVELSK